MGYTNLTEGQKGKVGGVQSSPGRKFLEVDEKNHGVPKSPSKVPKDLGHFKLLLSPKIQISHRSLEEYSMSLWMSLKFSFSF